MSTEPMTKSELDYYRKQHRKTVAALFEIDRAGLTEKYLKGLIRIRTPKMYRENVLDISWIFELCAYYREIAPYALPNGETLDFTRAEIEAYFGEPVDWDSFCGLDKPPGHMALIYFFRNYEDSPGQDQRSGTIISRSSLERVNQLRR